jgi:hypothetical protein
MEPTAMETAAEIAIATVIQIGTLIWLLSGLKSDVRNLTGWVTKIDDRVTAAAQVTAELKGQVQTLPCVRCSLKLGA